MASGRMCEDATAKLFYVCYNKYMKKAQNRSLRRHSIGMLALLIVESLLGMMINIYVQFPAGASAGQNWEFAQGQWLIWVHIVVGSLLVLGMIALYMRAAKLKARTWKISGGIASLSVIVAFVCGEGFVSNPQDILSFVMSLFFTVAVLSIFWGIYKTKELTD